MRSGWFWGVDARSGQFLNKFFLFHFNSKLRRVLMPVEWASIIEEMKEAMIAAAFSMSTPGATIIIECKGY